MHISRVASLLYSIATAGRARKGWRRLLVIRHRPPLSTTACALLAVCGVLVLPSVASGYSERMTYESSGGIYTSYLDGSNRTFLLEHGTSGRSADRPSLSPDGSEVAFDEFSCGIGVTDLHGHVTNIVNETGECLTGDEDRSPRWSPDGLKVVFQRAVPGSGEKNVDIWVVNHDGTGLTRLVNWPGNQESPTYSPDGTKLAFSSTATPSGGKLREPYIYVTNADGSSPVKLGAGTEPSFSPDGSQLAVLGAAFNSDIYTMSPITGKRTQVTKTGGHAGLPSWTVDGKHIIFTRDTVEGSQIYYSAAWISPNGSGETTLIAGPPSILGATPRQVSGSLGIADYLAPIFEPVLRFDASEAWRPLNIELFLAEHQH